MLEYCPGLPVALLKCRIIQKVVIVSERSGSLINLRHRTDLMSTLDVNVSGPQNITTAFLPLLRKGSRKLVINVYVYWD